MRRLWRWHLCLGLDDAGAHALYLRLVLLLLSYRHGAALLSLGLCYALIGLSLVYLELGAHVAAYVHVRYVYGEYFERSACIKALVEHGLGYKVGVFKHVLVALGKPTVVTMPPRLYGR